MNEAKVVIMKCCICGREKTEQGWQYQSRTDESRVVCSHGFCAACYAAEIMKIRMQTMLVGAPA